MRKLLVGVLGLVLVLTVAPAHAATTAPAAPSYTPTIAWHPCTGGLECGVISVPLDHADRDGAQIQLALTRRVHTVPAAEYQGAILLNPGGPGASGTHLPD
ncbi:MAG: peptidase, partial [Nocardioidaceae bacterium]|nr:peptidase [Nocardioidaceae bacterium]